jgi:choline dehydrogenase-like flavoprotein
MIDDADVLIIGSGIGGAAIFRSLQDTDARVVVLESGGQVSPNGAHLRNVVKHDEKHWRTLVAAMTQPPVRSANPLAESFAAGAFDGVRADQNPDESLPGFATCSALGGNSLVWSGIVLPPSSTADTGIAEERFTEAASWLNAHVVSDSPRQEWLAQTHELQPVPLAWSEDKGWIGANEIAGQGFQPAPQYCVRRIVHDQGRASAVEVHVEGDSKPRFISARHIVVAAGVVGTVRLLWASGFDRDLPGLGRGIAHHPVALAQVAMPEVDWSRLANQPALTRPAAARTFPAPAGGHTLIMFEPAWMMENRVDSRTTISIYAHRTLPRDAGRHISFVPETLGADGLPLPRFVMPLSAEEKDCERVAVEEARAWAACLGTTLPSGRARVLPRGADQHLACGASIGDENDPLSVAEPSGRIRSLENVWVAGAAALPNAVSTHPAQTIVALAAETGRHLKALLLKE